MKGFKRLAAVAMAAVMTVAGTCTAFAATSPATSVEPVKVTNTVVEASKDAPTAKVDTNTKGEATIKTLGATKVEKVVIATTVEVNGVEYKVTEVSAKAFAKCGEKTEAVSLPATITKIGAQAFTGSDLERVIIKSTKALTVDKAAFKGVDTKKMTIKVTKNMSKSQLTKLKKALKAAGFKGKVVQMKKH